MVEHLLVLDKIISQRDKGTSIGFGADVKNTQDKKTGEWMKTLEPEDLLKYGLIPEFIGRLTYDCNSWKI